MFEIHSQNRPFLLRGHVQEPHQQEEGHHGGDEVRISHFPASAVLFCVGLFYSFYDDLFGLVFFHAYFFLAFFTTDSSSRKEGLRLPGTTLLANSIAT